MSIKRVIVTGACGAVGSALVKDLMEQADITVGLLDNNEEKLFWLSKELSNHQNFENLRFILGDIRDANRLERAFSGADLIFHTAALKHVKLNEQNPFEVVKTNVLGVENVINAAIENSVEKVVFASSDKAVNPTSSMGASKLLGERLFIAANSFVGMQQTSFSCVRFGNILNSSGSVVPIFRKQLANNEPVTITDTSMTRYLITMRSALDLLYYAAENMIGGEIFVADMGAANILEIAKAVNNGHLPEFKLIGTLPGEKLYEELVTDIELKRTYRRNDYMVVLPDGIEDVSVRRRKQFAELYTDAMPNGAVIKSDENLMKWKDFASWI